MGAEDELVGLEVRDGVAVIELNRPARRNALTGPLLDQLGDHVEAAANDDDVRALVLCGAGGAFCSGLDLKEYGAEPPPSWLPTARASLKRAHLALARCEHPIVVALERFAINGGAAFALAGDLIVVGESAWLQVGEVQRSMDAPMNLAWLTARHSPAIVLQVTLPGEPIFGPDLALMNIAHEVVEDHRVRSRAEELACQLAGYPDGAATSMKRAALRLAATDVAKLETLIEAAVGDD